jgi:hypothetical protein
VILGLLDKVKHPRPSASDEAERFMSQFEPTPMLLKRASALFALAGR